MALVASQVLGREMSNFLGDKYNLFTAHLSESKCFAFVVHIISTQRSSTPFRSLLLTPQATLLNYTIFANPYRNAVALVSFECLDRQPSRSINIVDKDDISYQSSHSGR